MGRRMPNRNIWYWCLHCERAFKGAEECTYPDCDGWLWDRWRWREVRERNRHYPVVPERGMVYPLNPRPCDCFENWLTDAPWVSIPGGRYIPVMPELIQQRIARAEFRQKKCQIFGVGCYLRRRVRG
jgi:hypothetical protein